MKKNSLLGSTFDCSCGKKHQVPTQFFINNSEIFHNLSDIIFTVSSARDITIIADLRTYDVAGIDVKKSLKSSGLSIHTFILPDRQGESPEANDWYRDFILDNCPETDLYIAVGSGVVNDLTKWTAYIRNKPYVAFATAASMNGYGSANVAATIDGLKVLFHAQAPLAVVTHPDIIIGAPEKLTTSGLGDVLAKSVSSADWRLNQFLFGDYYCQFAVDLLKDLEPVYLNNPHKIREKEADGFEALLEALFYSSVAMTVTGTSSPASGGEHLISHTLDILAGRDNNIHDYHGRQVGIGSIFTASLYQRILELEKPVFNDPAPTVNTKFWAKLTPVVEQEYAKKFPKYATVQKILSDPTQWRELQSLIRPYLVSPKNLKECLKEANGAHIFSDIQLNGRPLTKNYFIAAIQNAHQMRDRFTILDLAILLGILPDKAEELVDQFLI